MAAIIAGIDGLPAITISGALEGDYVVLAKKANGALRIAPAQQGGVPTVIALKQTTWACPTQWEGILKDGRTLFAHCRRGELGVGIGDSVNDAIDNTAAEKALCFEYVADGPLTFAELRAHLYGLLEFAAGLKAEDQREPSLDLKTSDKVFAAKKSVDANPTLDGEGGSGAERARERVGEGLCETEIQEWTCFSCGRRLIQAHEGDYFHADADNECGEAIPIPTSLVQLSLQSKAPSGARGA